MQLHTKLSNSSLSKTVKADASLPASSEVTLYLSMPFDTSNMFDCNACAQLRYMLFRERYIDYGTLLEAAANKCQLCDLLRYVSEFALEIAGIRMLDIDISAISTVRITPDWRKRNTSAHLRIDYSVGNTPKRVHTRSRFYSVCCSSFDSH